ncbi:MAG TPA: hypothetical protein VGN95_11725 [Pyrinomonadaceae bacterium]|jgi:uncharacterized protein (AIM24 family)|nr:hypothetical protein [Pyrinomonadaceae bacterium]
MEIATAPQRSHRIIKTDAKRGEKIDARIDGGTCARTGATIGKTMETGMTNGAGVAGEGMVVVSAQIVAMRDAKRGVKTGMTTVNKT